LEIWNYLSAARTAFHIITAISWVLHDFAYDAVNVSIAMKTVWNRVNQWKSRKYE
jgi:hypothetical protein